MKQRLLIVKNAIKREQSSSLELPSASILREANSQLSTGKSHFQRFLDLLHSSQVKHRTVEAYASELCISPKYLTAICKKNSGKTTNNRLLGCKVIRL